MKQFSPASLRTPLVRHLLSLFCLSLIGFCLFANSLDGEFLVDDEASIVHNPRNRDHAGFSLQRLSPVTGWLWEESRALLWRFAGRDPRPYHLFNMALHAGCVALLYLLLQVLFRDGRLSLLAALIFAVHPLHAETVCWISAGHYLLSGFFFLLSALLYTRLERGALYQIGTALSFFLCLSSGNAAATLPLWLLGYELLARPATGKSSRQFRVALLSLFTAVAVCAVAAILLSRNRQVHQIFFFRGASYLIVITKAFLYYLKILYLPLERGLFHPFAYADVSVRTVSPAFFAGLGALGLAGWGLWRCRRNFPACSFGIVWFFAGYLPYSNIIPVCNIISERYLYLASAGSCLVLAAFFLRAWDRIQSAPQVKALRIASVAALTLFLGSYTFLSVKHSMEFRDILIFWETNIRNFPEGFKAYNNLAGTYYQLGNRQQAIAYCWVSLMINEAQPHVWCNLGKVYGQEGKRAEALFCYRRALTVDPGYGAARQALRLMGEGE